MAAPAAAQVAIEAALQTDYRVRGYSISDGNPAASVSLSYDDPTGIYLGGSVIGTIDDDEPALLGIQGSAGYAMRLSPALAIDAGVSKTQYFYGYGTSTNYDYTEVYLGLALPRVAARLSYSPDYYRNETETLYGEIDAGFEPAENWFLSAHAGVLNYLDTPPFYVPKQAYDWRIGASRQFGRYGVHVDVSGRIQGRARYAIPGGPGSGRDPATVVFSLTRAF
jgi:uncharacterized protein (TIGR02001 family)